ncbi:MAG TPA: GH116 family glycosyl hydrolase [Steroidobacteraceae bacterium]|nr:GH116 family glycosyl hydrolase [Steroidobacteraceae bacterium]
MYVQTVEELMTGVTGVDFVQPWYRCVSTSKGNTGMALGGIGTAITATPAGTTPCFHFYNGCGIENEDGQTIELNNYFYGECISDDLTLQIRSHSFFQEDCVAFPLVDHRGEKYFTGNESEEQALDILRRIIVTDTFVEDNYENLCKWGLISQEKQGTLYHSRKESDYRFRNYAFLLNIFSFSVTRNIVFTRSLIADLQCSHRLFKECYPSGKMLYEFQYPLSVTHYREETQRCVVKKIHMSCISPDNERLCNMPAYMTGFQVTNPTYEAMDVSFVLSVENFIGYDLVKTRTGVQDALLRMQRGFKGQKGESYVEELGDSRIHGFVFNQDDNAHRGDIQGELCFAVITRNSDDMLVTIKPAYFIGTESNVVNAGIAVGKIHDVNDDAVSFTGREPRCGAFCVSFRVMPGETKGFGVSTVLDIPALQIGDYSAQKKYTAFFADPVNRSRTIARYIFENREKLYTHEWVYRESLRHKQVLDSGVIDSAVVARLRQMLADNMSFIAESAVWDANDRFLVRECIDYPFFNSLDVYFYGSFGLLKLLPQVDNRIVREFGESILSEDLRPKLFGSFVRFRDGRINQALRGVRKVLGSTPHDMGTPFDAAANAYSWKDAALWVDLAPKYVLLVYRSFLTTRDLALLRDSWPSVKQALEYIREKFIGDEGYLPVSVGYANTFDNLRGDGICIYPASLWVAGLRAAEAMAVLLGEHAAAKSYAEMAARGKAQLLACLWDEQAGMYLYSVSPVRRIHIDEKEFAAACNSNDGRFSALLEAIGGKPLANGSINTFLAAINAFVDDDAATLAVKQLAPAGSLDATQLHALQQLHRLSKMERRALKKRFVHACLPGMFIKDFETAVVQAECDHVFANQLCADTYLYYLDLPEITGISARRRILKNIMEQNIAGGEYRIGASNLVARGGADLDTHQAQEVWLGVQYSLAGALVAAGMIKEFEELIVRLFEAIYEQAKIPFGIPEGFNCVGLFIAEDLIRADIDDEDLRAEIIDFLKKANILSAGNVVNFAAIEDARKFADFWDDEENEYAGYVGSEELRTLLLATQLKYTAGRYFRAGMVHILPEILRKYKISIDQQSDEEACLAILRSARAGEFLKQHHGMLSNV